MSFLKKIARIEHGSLILLDFGWNFCIELSHNWRPGWSMFWPYLLWEIDLEFFTGNHNIRIGLLGLSARVVWWKMNEKSKANFEQWAKDRDNALQHTERLVSADEIEKRLGLPKYRPSGLECHFLCEWDVFFVWRWKCWNWVTFTPIQATYDPLEGFVVRVLGLGFQVERGYEEVGEDSPVSHV